jgi:hypothetical protein
MEFQRLAAGTIAAHQQKVDGRPALVIEGSGGAVFGAIGTKPNDKRASKRDPETLGTTFESLAGSWFIPTLLVPDKHRPVLDAAGTEVAAVDYTSSSRRELRLPGGDLVWERHVTRPQYRIEGCFGASRSAMHAFVAGVSRTPFKGEITDGLAGHPEGSLALLLACWLTDRVISDKAAAQSD